MMWMVIFLALAFLLFMIPLLPGLAELKRADDIKPLKIIQEYDTDIKHFAISFRSFLEKEFSPFFTSAKKMNTKSEEGELDDGKKFQIIGSSGAPKFKNREITKHTTKRLIISASPLVLPRKMVFETEVYCHGSVKAGHHSQFRALLAESDITLGKNCMVMRWVHSAASLHAAAGCSLFGRTSADEIIILSENCRFERLSARKIMFGRSYRSKGKPPIKEPSVVKMESLPDFKSRYGKRWLFDGDVTIPANSFFDGDIISMKNIFIGAGCHITGSIKSNHNTFIDSGVHINGAVFSAGDLHINQHCNIAGPVISEAQMIIDGGTVVGSENLPTTISAPQIDVAIGVVTFGTVWADESAIVSHRISA